MHQRYSPRKRDIAHYACDTR